MKRLFVCLVALVVAGAGRLAAQTERECPPLLRGVETAPFTYYLGVGDAYAERQQFAEALTAYTCAVDAEPGYAPSYARRGYAHTALGDSDAAIADFEQALTLDETLTDVYLNRGLLYTRSGNYGLAIGDFTLVLGLEPQNAVALQNRALVHAIENNYEQALADLEQAMAADPENPAPYAARAALYSAFVMRDYQRFLEISGSPEAPLPAGTPTEVLTAIDDSLRSGSISMWLALLQAAP